MTPAEIIEQAEALGFKRYHSPEGTTEMHCCQDQVVALWNAATKAERDVKHGANAPTTPYERRGASTYEVAVMAWADTVRARPR